MRRIVFALLLLCLTPAVAAADCATVPAPQAVGTPNVASGLDANCNLTPYQVPFNGLNFASSLFGSSVHSSSMANVGQGTLQLTLDEPGQVAVNYTLQISSNDDPLNIMWGLVTALDNSTGATQITVSVFAANGGGTYANWNVQVTFGPPQGVAASAAVAVDSTDSFAVPSLGAQITLTLDDTAPKAFGFQSLLLVQALTDPPDTAAWFFCAVVSYTSTPPQTVTCNVTPQTGTSTVQYQLWTVQLITPSGANGFLYGYSQNSVSFPNPAPGQVTFATQSGQYFPLDGQVQAICLATPSYQMTGQVLAFPVQAPGSSENLVLNVTSESYGATGSCSSWLLYTTTGPTTRISLYQMNGLQISLTTVHSGTEYALSISPGAVRDSQDVTDLILSTTTTAQITNYTGAGAPNVATSGPLGGDITSIGTAVTGSCTGGGLSCPTFTANFGTGSNSSSTDLNNQLTALGLSLTLPSNPIIYGFLSSSSATALVANVASNTSLTTNTSMGASGWGYERGGPISVNATSLTYVVYLALNNTTGAIQPYVGSLTPTGVADLPTGYTYTRAIALCSLSAVSSVVTLNYCIQPMAIFNALLVPNHDLIVGSGTSPPTFLAPSATTGVPLVSNGPSSNPGYGTAAIAGGGTGQITAPAAFGALSPLTTEGDLLYYHSSANARLGIGSGVLIGGSDPAWSTALPNGTTGTTQSAGDDSTKVATTAYVDTHVSWKQVASGSFPSASTLAVAIPAGYSDILISFSGVSFDTATRALFIQVSTNNGSSYDSTAANYNAGLVNYTAGTSAAGSNASIASTGTQTAAATVSGTAIIFGYATGGFKAFQALSLQSTPQQNGTFGTYVGPTSSPGAAITNIQFLLNGTGNFDAGTYMVSVK